MTPPSRNGLSTIEEVIADAKAGSFSSLLMTKTAKMKAIYVSLVNMRWQMQSISWLNMAVD